MVGTRYALRVRKGDGAQRTAFVSLLRSLDAPAWGLSTACPGWSVKDVVSHVLSDDLL
jgi:hypothetical protein